MRDENPQEPKIPPSRPDDRPIDDMPDGMDIHQRPDRFGQVISYIHASLYEEYARHDSRAILNQKRHRLASWIAIGAGTATILISLTGVVLAGRGSELGLNFARDLSFGFQAAEMVFFLIAFLAVLIAKWIRKYLENWLAERFCAEEYRSRKFRALLRCSLFCDPEKPWNERYALWKTGFDDEARATKKEMMKSAGQCVVSDTVSAPPPDISGCRLDEAYLKDLVNYYQDKRLKSQIDYFDRRFDKLEKQDGTFRWILAWAFTLSIILVFFKIAIDFLRVLDENSVLYIPLIMIMLTLPIIAFGIRTLRSSTEVARSASLYRANRNALENFRNRLVVENAREPPRWQETVKILWECENHLARVNLEWVRIMKEAEWFV